MNDDDDALLTAFADNALGTAERSRLAARLAEDARLRARLDEIEAGGRPFAPAFAALLEEAPMDRLRASVATAILRSQNLNASPPVPISRWRAMAAGIALAALLAGLAAGRLSPSWLPMQEAAESHDDWREAIAQYMKLYTADTLASDSADSAMQATDLKALGAKLGMTVSLASIELAGLPFKRSELLSYDNAPLGQLAYLDPQSGPVLFCIIADSRPDAPITNDAVGSFATSSWAKDGRGYMVIGRMQPEKVAGIAGELARRF